MLSEKSVRLKPEEKCWNVVLKGNLAVLGLFPSQKGLGVPHFVQKTRSEAAPGARQPGAHEPSAEEESRVALGRWP